VFVVEAVGSGTVSRALICKGRLRHLERISAAGHAFTVLQVDELRHLSFAGFRLLRLSESRLAPKHS
jgi:hypothetical protein